MIPVVYITDNNFIMQTSVAITSLLMNKAPDTVYEIYVITADCSDDSKAKLKELETEQNKIRIVEASLEDYRDIKQMSHVPIACLLKFDLCELIPEHDKLLYMDGDVLVMKDLSSLYETPLEDCYVAASKELKYIDKQDGKINAGIMLFNAKKMREDNMRDKLVETRKKLGDRGSMDQQTYNLVIKDQVKYISLLYNCVPGNLLGEQKQDCTIEQINSYYGCSYTSAKELVEDAYILHFASGNKPWKYTFAPYAKEWHKYYLSSPYKEVPFKRYGRWRYRVHHLTDILKKEGLLGVVNYLQERQQKKITKKEVDWE